MTSLYGGIADPSAASATNAAAGREPPMFALNRMNIRLNHDIEQLVANNQTMVVLMGKVLHRINLSPASSGSDPIERLLELPDGVRIVRMFLDPQASHLLLTVRMPVAVPPVQQFMQQATSSGMLGGGSNSVGADGGFTHELWYLHRTSREPKRCERYRGHEITAVGWNRAGGADAMTGAILLGTSQGVLFETELSCMPGEKRGGAAVNWKQVFDIGKGAHCPIIGLDFHKVPNTGRHIVVVSTPNRLYQFLDDLCVEERYPYLHHIFASYLNRPDCPTHSLTTALDKAALRFLYDTPGASYPRFYGWLTADGLYAGNIDATADKDDFIGPKEIIPYPVLRVHQTASGEPLPSVSAGAVETVAAVTPIAFELTDYHVLLLYADRLVAVSRLTHAIEYEQPLAGEPAHGPVGGTSSSPLGLCRDQRAAGGTVYLYTGKEIMRVRVRDEQRHVWRHYMERGDFAAAQRSTRNAAHLNRILIREADVCFGRGEFMLAAKRYAESRAGFETVCLQFIHVDAAGADGASAEPARRDALLLFVRQRLNRLKADEQTQITMLVVWLFELYVTEMAGAGDGTDRRRRLQDDYQAFMAQPRVAECVQNHRSVFYGLLAAHGDTGNLAALRATGGDVETVLEQHIELGDFVAALAVLRRQATAAPELWYRWAPVLMEELPAQTVGALCQQDGRLDVERLLPALMCVDTDAQRGEVMRFLEWAIHKMACKSQAMHNYLIQLYARWRPERLMSYLGKEGTVVRLVHYDVQFALRVCNQYERSKASVFLYSLLELWPKAVELALTFDPELAEQTAVLTDDLAVRRQLWLRIAEHRIQGGNDVRQALNVLRNCDGLLRIEDVLPYFSDFDRIEHFKEAVIDALHQSNEEVQRHREEMDESARAAELVRDELQAFRQRAVRIAADAPCTVCAGLLMQRPFLVFQCGHMVHVDCAERTIVRELGTEDRQRLAKLHERMAVQSPTATVAEQMINGQQLTDRERAKSEYEELIAAECLFCGNHMIESIDRPFGGNRSGGGDFDVDEWE